MLLNSEKSKILIIPIKKKKGLSLKFFNFSRNMFKFKKTSSILKVPKEYAFMHKSPTSLFSTHMNHISIEKFGDTSVLKIKSSPLPVYFHLNIHYNDKNPHISYFFKRKSIQMKF